MPMLSIPVSNDVSRLFQEIEFTDANKDRSDHITMFYFDNLKMSQILKIIPVVYDITSETKPFEINCTKITCFDKGKHGYPVVAKIESNYLQKIRKSLIKKFEENNIKFSNDFPKYIPHITLGYSEKKISDINLKNVNIILLQMGLYCGEESDSKLFVNFPFTLKVNKTEKIASIYLNCSRK